MIDDIAGISSCDSDSVVLNGIINSKIESKKQQFHEKKSEFIHIGPNKSKCHKLKVHESIMMKSESQKYLGDVICSSGLNSLNIKNRKSIGFATISQIKSILSEVKFGTYTIQSGLIMRDAILISKLLLNSEVWHSVTKAQIEELEVIDRILLRQILGAHSKTGIEWIYADCGRLDIKSLIQTRRLMYLWHILTRNENELIHRTYKTQSISSVKGDWVRLVNSDKAELEINLTDSDIKRFSKQSFKRFIKQKVSANFVKRLNTLKENHSKSQKLKCEKLNLAEYLQTAELSTTQKMLLFKLRSKTIEVKANFPGIGNNNLCISCGLFPETQAHLLHCSVLTSKLSYVWDNTSVLNEDDIYGSIENQKVIVNIYTDLLAIREQLKNEHQPSVEGPVHTVHV